jgi:hypothetical protein
MFSFGIRHGNRLRLVVIFAALDQTAMGVFLFLGARDGGQGGGRTSI